MKIAIGCDHIVTSIKNEIVTNLRQQNYDVIDCGTYDDKRTHYPIYGHKVATLVANNTVDRGIVLCGTGVGIANSANKVKGSRCALVKEPLQAKIAVEEFDANIIAFGGRIVGIALIEEIIATFLISKYQEKNKKIINHINQVIKTENYQNDIFIKEITDWEKGKYHD